MRPLDFSSAGVLALVLCCAGCPPEGGYSEDRLDPEALSANRRGLEEFGKSEWEAAALSFTAAIARDPSQSLFWANRAKALFHCQQHQEAIADASKAIELNPSDFSSYVTRAECYSRLNDPARAVPDYSKAISNYQSWRDAPPRLLVNRGYNRVRLGDDAGATQDFDAAIDGSANDPGARALALYNRALCHARSGASAKAIEDLQAVLALDAYLAKEHIDPADLRQLIEEQRVRRPPQREVGGPL